MKAMSQDEIMDLIRQRTWGTLIAVDGNKPYAVELSYGSDGQYIYCGSVPGGRMYRCIQKNRNVAFKICDSNDAHPDWRAVIIEAEAERLTEYEDFLCLARAIAKQKNLPEDQFYPAAKRFFDHPESNCLKIPIKNAGGRKRG